MKNFVPCPARGETKAISLGTEVGDRGGGQNVQRSTGGGQRVYRGAQGTMPWSWTWVQFNQILTGRVLVN